ncbi:response regulator [Tranquillimonas alkanivorans]|uniref:Response regulator receiver domain-containing protein n=1 Tax=Tranquillimonas alkanivorans TaxID=441119 RepID=A0A1I5QB02_9RHOB|nr:response regulator [Tranquillimonas alkanivorans]SFP43435.1 Response regulator receiver domain-containing protein [Tranquillimonas alkanivorans]
MLVLVVEDEALLALDLSQMIEDADHRVLGPFARPEAAVAACKEARPDMAFLDFNLAGQTSEAVAEALIEDDVPFVFLTAHGRAHLPDRYRDVQVLQKPVPMETVPRLLDHGPSALPRV